VYSADPVRPLRRFCLYLNLSASGLSAHSHHHRYRNRSQSRRQPCANWPKAPSTSSRCCGIFLRGYCSTSPSCPCRALIYSSLIIRGISIPANPWRKSQVLSRRARSPKSLPFKWSYFRNSGTMARPTSSSNMFGGQRQRESRCPRLVHFTGINHHHLPETPPPLAREAQVLGG
jgi:hypothetical protein